MATFEVERADGDHGARNGVENGIGGKLASLKQRGAALVKGTTEHAEDTEELALRAECKIVVRGLRGSDGEDYRSEDLIRPVFEKVPGIGEGGVRKVFIKIREQDGKDTSWALVDFEDPSGARSAIRAFKQKTIPQCFSVEMFDVLRAERSSGTMMTAYKSSASLAEYEEEEVHKFKSSEIFEVLSEHVTMQSIQAKYPWLRVCLRYAIEPKNPWRLRWDAMMLGVVVFSSLAVPFDAAFRPNKPPDWLTLTMDILFYSDIMLNFNTGYDKGYEEVMDKSKIVAHYLKSWFFIDLVATVDWEIVAKWIQGPDSDSEIWIKMLALIKIFRLLRAGRLIDKLTTSWVMQTGLVDALKFFLYVTVVAHLLACFFFLWPVLFQWGGDCDQDMELSNAVRECISGGDCGDSSPTDGLGWYFKEQCRQNGWRQQYNLEEICVPKLCSPIDDPAEGDFDLSYDLYQYFDLGTRCRPESEFSTPVAMTADEEKEFLLRCLDTAEQKLTIRDPRYQLCPNCMDPWRRYIDALYWSLTTMTTIGYGDRGPATENELYYVLFAEVFGLAFFALLLTQIDRVSMILTKDKQAIRDQKDGVLQFAMHRRVPMDLIINLVQFMNFRANSLSGNAYDDENFGFNTLSDNLKQRIKHEVYLPKLKKICFFGWDDKDDMEEDTVKRFFDEIDTDGSGELDKDEVKTLFARLDLTLKEAHFEACWSELDRKENGTVKFDEFSWWWFLTKYGVPRISSGVKCPMSFLETMCEHVEARPFAKGERLVELGGYGEYFVILLTGKLRVKRPGCLWGSPRSHPDDKNRSTVRDIEIKPEDREPIFGFSACLTKSQHDYVKYRTDSWTVEADEYTDTLWVSRKDFFGLTIDHWMEGRADIVELCYYHYQVGQILNGKTEMHV